MDWIRAVDLAEKAGLQKKSAKAPMVGQGSAKIILAKEKQGAMTDFPPKTKLEM